MKKKNNEYTKMEKRLIDELEIMEKQAEKNDEILKSINNIKKILLDKEGENEQM